MTSPRPSMEKILTACGLAGATVHPVSGGDINEAYQVRYHQTWFFLKINNARRYPQMFQKEANGLQALRKAGSMRVPQVIQTGDCDNDQYLLLEWLEQGKPSGNFWENFGASLATLHRQTQPDFGWNEDNYIGSLLQKNTSDNNWPSFYARCRIQPLTTILAERKDFHNSDKQLTERLCNHLPDVIPPESPALLHGDLWSGNFMVVASGEAAVYDPAVYFGHREMDLAMSRLFGGFDDRFYEAYHQVYPLEKEWRSRIALMQLYPVLVHAVLFGGHYIQQARSIITQYA
jgi:fructosamine-3-kinase